MGRGGAGRAGRGERGWVGVGWLMVMKNGSCMCYQKIIELAELTVNICRVSAACLDGVRAA